MGVVRSGEIERGTESRSIRFGIRRRVPSNSEQDDKERGGHEVGGEEVLHEDPIKAQELVRSTFARSLGEGTRQTTPGEAHESRTQPAHEVGGVARARQLMDERSTVERGQERRRLRRTYRAHFQRYMNLSAGRGGFVTKAKGLLHDLGRKDLRLSLPAQMRRF